MSGPDTITNLAKLLREEADKINNKDFDDTLDRIYKIVIDGAKKETKRGVYSFKTFDDSLIDKDICKALKKRLDLDGFHVIIAEDCSFSEHARQPMFYVEVKW